MKGLMVTLFKTSLVFFFLTAYIFAQSLPENHAVNGGLTIIPIDIKQKPEAYFNDKRIIVTPSPNENQWLLIVGIPLDSHQEIQRLTIKKPLKATVPFHVSEKFYKTQYLTISNKRKVDPFAKDRKRIDQENEKMAKLFATWTDGNPFKEKYIAPVHGPISSLFGLRRVYNKKPRAPHSGLDIAAPAGTPVKVTSQGKVVDADNYFFTGNTVIVDHGQGVFSLYAHLSEINVKKGEKIKQGDIIGKVGQTGRVTGPHLHWSMVMNETLVDPLLFVPVRTVTSMPDKPEKIHKTKAPTDHNS